MELSRSIQLQHPNIQLTFDDLFETHSRFHSFPFINTYIWLSVYCNNSNRDRDRHRHSNLGQNMDAKLSGTHSREPWPTYPNLERSNNSNNRTSDANTTITMTKTTTSAASNMTYEERRAKFVGFYSTKCFSSRYYELDLAHLISQMCENLQLEIQRLASSFSLQLFLGNSPTEYVQLPTLFSFFASFRRHCSTKRHKVQSIQLARKQFTKVK